MLILKIRSIVYFINYSNFNMSSLYHILAVLMEHLRKYRVKTDLRNDQGLTPLHLACSQGHIEAAR